MYTRNGKGQFIKGIYQGFGFKIGLKPWNKNKKGIHLSSNSEFKKGTKPWNAGKGVPYFDKSTGYMKISIFGKQLKYHRYVMEEHLGRKLAVAELVHHKNYNKLDNRINNLEIILRSEHMRLHWTIRKGND